MQTAHLRLLHDAGLDKLAAGICALLMLVAGAYPSRADPWFLDQIRTVRVAEVQRFDAAHHFKVGSIVGGRKLSTIGLNFTQHFSALVEENLPATSLAVWNLRYTMGDTPLVAALAVAGEPSVSHLAQIHSVMEMGGENGGHTDWRSNFAYVRSPIDHSLWAVHWTVNYAGEWIIGAVYIPHPDLDWPAGSRLFSPHLSESTSQDAQSILPAGE